MKKSILWILALMFTFGVVESTFAQKTIKVKDKKKYEQMKKEEDRKVNAAKTLNEGNRLYRSKNYTKAIKKYEESLTYDPNNPKVYRGLGLCYSKLGKVNKAIHNFRKALSVDSKYYPAAYSLGNFYRNLGKYREAINAYTSGIQIKSDYYKFYKQRGYVYYKLGAKQKALADYKQCQKLGAKDASVYRYMAQVYLDLKNYKGAISSADLAIKYTEKRRRSTLDKPYWIKGESYLAIKQYAKAIEAYKSAIRYSKKLFFKSASYFGIGVAYKALGNKTKAKQNFQMATKSPDWRAKAEYELKRI